MIFMTYWFATFTLIFFPLYWIAWNNLARRLLLLVGCTVFHVHFAGPAGVLPIVALAFATYLAGLNGRRLAIYAAIFFNVGTLIYYKYFLFFSDNIIGLISADANHHFTEYAKGSLLPSAPPLAVSFFVFEFVHYLTDVRRGTPSIRSPLQFSLFAIFWPSIVAGPIKRYEQFLPALNAACASRVESGDMAAGLTRVAMGVGKKIIADNFTSMIEVYSDGYSTLPLPYRWLFVIGIAFRILLDFSGYSDIAIGFARMTGVRLPENFNWPYLATNLSTFWRRWHISLSTWIRDYIYIPLGGGRHGAARRIGNALAAFALCGLWHGAGWNFAIWGIYHGVGVAISIMMKNFIDRFNLPNILRTLRSFLSWIVTFIFVLIGWLIFFYPVDRAISMTYLLFMEH